MNVFPRRAGHLIKAACAVAAFASNADAQSETTAEAGDPDLLWPTLTGAAPLVIAHRGASGERPEHTIEAYSLAIDQGADVIEPDLVITKDGVLVARHDRYLSTTTNVADVKRFARRKRTDRYAIDSSGDSREDWWVEDFTYAELLRLRARQPRVERGDAFDDQFTIPTFHHILALADARSAQRGRPIGVYPETKHPDYFKSIGLDMREPLLKAIRNYYAGPVFVQSFEPGILKRLKGETSATLVQLVYEENAGDGPNISLRAAARYADAVGPQKSLIWSEPDFVSEAHRRGLLVHPWTFRDDDPASPPADPARCAIEDPRAEIACYLDAGVDGFFTDFPATGAAARSDAARKFRAASQ